MYKRWVSLKYAFCEEGWLADRHLNIENVRYGYAIGQKLLCTQVQKKVKLKKNFLTKGFLGRWVYNTCRAFIVLKSFRTQTEIWFMGLKENTTIIFLQYALTTMEKFSIHQQRAKIYLGKAFLQYLP